MKIKNLFQCKGYKVLFVFIAVMAVIGSLLNGLCSHRNFYLNQGLLFIMLIIQVLALKAIDKENSAITSELKRKEEYKVLKSFNFIIYVPSSIVCKLVSIAMVSMYIITMFVVGCLDWTVTGIYGGILGAVVFYVGIQAYFKYLGLLYFSWNLKNLEINHYFFYYPVLTGWIDRLAHEFSYIEKRFVILGLMYCGIYMINIPTDSIVFKPSTVFQTTPNTLFTLTWVGIIIFFVIAVPVFMLLSRHFLKKCIGQCKRRSIEILDDEIFELSSNNTQINLLAVKMRLMAIKDISISADSPFKYKYIISDEN